MSNYKLVLANGAFKSGSTWLREIAKCLLDFEFVPPKYASKKRPRWLLQSKILDLLGDREYCGIYLSKAHIFEPILVSSLLARSDVRILNITRDLRDVLVSHYYHYSRVRSANLAFTDYYWSIGRFKAIEVQSYNNVWSAESDNVFFTAYEDLKANFASEVTRMADFFGREISLDDIEIIAEETSLTRLMKTRNEQGQPESKRFFRKGVVGDWRNHFSNSEEEDLNNITQNGFDRRIDQLRYHLMFPFRRKVLGLIKKY